MHTIKKSSERGQTLVLVVIGFLVFVAVLALVLDGGNAYAARRQAQNAADAGALAGATYMCQHRNEAGVVASAIGVAEDYAVLNEAVDPPDVYASLDAASVMVTATVTRVPGEYDSEEEAIQVAKRYIDGEEGHPLAEAAD